MVWDKSKRGAFFEAIWDLNVEKYHLALISSRSSTYKYIVRKEPLPYHFEMITDVYFLIQKVEQGPNACSSYMCCQYFTFLTLWFYMSSSHRLKILVSDS